MSDYRSKPVYNYPLFDNNAYSQASAIDEDPRDFQSAGKSTPRNVYYPLTINPREVEQQPNNIQSYYTTSSRNASISSGSNLEEENENTAPQRATGGSRRRSNSRTQSVFDPNRNMFVEISRSQRHYCPELDCVDENGKRKSLSRLADLKRHKNSVHAAPSIDCHYPGCDKKGENGFKRKDHYMDHLRDRHREPRETSRVLNEF